MLSPGPTINTVNSLVSIAYVNHFEYNAASYYYQQPKYITRFQMALKFHSKFLNPFSHLIEVNLSRLKRTGWVQKLKDAHRMFMGSPHTMIPFASKGLGKPKFGLLDWMMLQIPTLITLAKIGSWELLKKLPGIAKVFPGLFFLAFFLLSAALQFTLFLTKQALSAALTVAVAPLILLIQGIVNLAVWKKWKSLNDQYSNTFDIEKTIQAQHNADQIRDLSDLKLKGTALEKLKGTLTNLEAKQNANSSPSFSDGIDLLEDTVDMFCDKVTDLSNFQVEKTENTITVKTSDDKEVATFNSIVSFKKSPLFFFNIGHVAQTYENEIAPTLLMK